MHNSKLDTKSSVISTMSSGMRDDAWHWKGKDVSLFSSEKLLSILRLSPQAQSREDVEALKRVQQELERRSVGLK